MALVVWTSGAIAELELIRAYIAIFDPAAAIRLTDRLRQTGDSLSDFPNRGRPAGNGMRELPSIRPYIVRFTVRNDWVYILAIKHGAQRR